MLTSWHAFWHAIEPYFFTLVGLFFLVFTGLGLFTRVTYFKGSKIYRAETPIAYWFSIVFAFLWGVIAISAGIALL